MQHTIAISFVMAEVLQHNCATALHFLSVLHGDFTILMQP